MKLGSLFDGIGGFPLSAIQHGIEPVWASEIEPFPILVTKKHFPNMKHLGDITKINGAEIEPVEIITGGSPCQDLSVAGKRAGLAGERSGLFMEQIRIVKEMREHDRATGRSTESIRPRFMVWENVPGAFSSNGGEDFRVVLEETARIADETVTIPRPRDGKWNTAGAIMGRNFSIAWRVLDAQYWGVPQRRRRIFLVADFGGQSAPEILFKCKGLSRHITESRKTREEVAAGVERSVDGAKQYLFENHSQDTRYVGPLEVSPIVSATFGMGGNNQPFVVKPSGYTVRRLTPTECERLQGFPDDWTNIPGAKKVSKEELEFWRGVWYEWDKMQSEEPEEVSPRTDKAILRWLKNPTSDTARYKALGNSVAIPCVTWIMGQIVNELRRNAEEG